MTGTKSKGDVTLFSHFLCMQTRCLFFYTAEGMTHYDSGIFLVCVIIGREMQITFYIVIETVWEGYFFYFHSVDDGVLLLLS